MIIDGRGIAKHILTSLTFRVKSLQETYDIQPHLAVIRVGEDPAITSYINQKDKMAKEIGAIVSVYNFPIAVKEEALKECIAFLQEKGSVHGLILQLPVPKHIDYEKLILDIHPDKDVDGFRPNSQFVIPVAQAALKVLEIPMIQETLTTGDSFNEWLRSKKIVVMGKGKTGGQPITKLLKERGVDVQTVDSSTTHVTDFTKAADIIISAVGKPKILTSDMIKKGAILVGVGMSMNDDGKFVGDYDEVDIQDKAEWYTPIPGGVGPVNVACLMENLVIAAEHISKN